MNFSFIMFFISLTLSVILFLYHDGCNLILTIVFIFLGICVLYRTLKKEVRLAYGVYNFLREQANRASVISLDLLYKRLGHPFIYVMKHFPDFPNYLNSTMHECLICFQAKQYRNKFPLSDTNSSQLFDLVNCDVWVRTNKNLLVNLLTSLL